MNQPEYGGPPRMPKKGVSPWVWIVGVFFLLCCGGGILGTFAIGRGVSNVMQSAKPLTQCTLVVTAVKEGLNGYAKKEGKFPAAANWQADIATYYAQYQQVFEKEIPPMMKDWGMSLPPIKDPLVCVWPDGQKTGIAMNSEIAGKAMGEVPASSVAVFEVPETGMNLTHDPKKVIDKAAPKFMNSAREWLSVTLDDASSFSDSIQRTEQMNTR